MDISDHVKELIDMIQQALLADSGRAVSSSGVEVWSGSHGSFLMKFADKLATTSLECDMENNTFTIKLRDEDIERTIKAGIIQEVSNVIGEFLFANVLIR